VAEPYVCIGVKSSCQAGFWNNGNGWNIVTAYLKSLGYRVLAIDRETAEGMSFSWNRIPREAEDFTGNLPLSDRIALLRHADFFIGLGGGPSWPAWACEIPVIMISGFSLPNYEFYTPYRVYSTHGCAGCWNEVAVDFDHRDFFWCPHFEGTERRYECTRLITGKQVIGHIDRLMRDHGLMPPNRREKDPAASIAAEITLLNNARTDQAVAQLTACGREVKRVLEILEDDACREQYRRELRFMVLRPLLRDDAAVLRLAGNVSPEAWQAALSRAEELRAAGDLPDLAYPPSADWVIPSIYASQFVLEQYRYGEVVDVSKGDVFLDCGACCGETAVWAANRGAGKVYSFEPHPESQGYLLANAKKYGHGRISLVPCGVGATEGRAGMITEAGNLGGTRLVMDTAGAASVVVLDDWCRENAVRPDFIKMDIEGAEMAALRGARKVITENRPRLAVCLYHRLSDMWEIPLLLKEMVPEYRFWCRKNAICVEFVLYASV
jgi:FkbM family methyltransferase